jgi:hypothetical protein
MPFHSALAHALRMPGPADHAYSCSPSPLQPLTELLHVLPITLTSTVTTFHVFYTWLPVYLRSRAVGVPAQDTLAPQLLGMLLYAIFALLTGRFVGDGRAPKLHATLCLYAVLVALVPPALLWVGRGSIAARWVVLPLGLAGGGCSAALCAFIGPSLFPAGVRASGYNIFYNLGYLIFGGELFLSFRLFFLDTLANIRQPKLHARPICCACVWSCSLCSNVFVSMHVDMPHAPCLRLMPASQTPPSPR